MLAMIIGLFLFFMAAPGSAQELAFPGAEGYGRFTVGGTGGRVIDVTNLNDSGPGSLRQCAQVETGPRICRVTVSGTVIAASPYPDILITSPNITIDATGQGFALRNNGIDVRADQVIIRNVRVRPGPARWFLTQNSTKIHTNGITIRSKPDGTHIKQVIVEHCSISWGTDDLINIVFGADYVTIQDSILAEGLVGCGGECGSKGLLIGYGAQHISILRNLSANTWTRWPEYTGGGSNPGYLQFVNNLHYNGNGSDTLLYPLHGKISANFIGNEWIDGPDGIAANLGYPIIRAIANATFSSASWLFVKDNIGRHFGPGGYPVVQGLAVPDTKLVRGDNGPFNLATTPLPDAQGPMPTVTVLPASETKAYVLAHAGAFPRDAADARIVAGVQNRNGRWVKVPDDVGGWPQLAAGDPPPAPLPPPPETPPLPPPPPTPVPTPSPLPVPIPVPASGITVTTQTQVQTVTTGKVTVEMALANCPGGTSTITKYIDAAGVKVLTSDPQFKLKAVKKSTEHICKP